jgi:hypothetical protein
MLARIVSRFTYPLAVGRVGRLGVEFSQQVFDLEMLS